MRTYVGASPTDHLLSTFDYLACADGLVAVFAKNVRSQERRSPAAAIGYFDHASREAFLEAVLAVSSRCDAVYLSLNPIRADRLHAAPNILGRGVSGPTIDDVLRLRTLLIDVDVDTAELGPSNEEERVAAYALAERACRALADRGFPEPIVCDSGNGFHLLYRLDLPTTDSTLVESCTKWIAAQCASPGCRIDTSVFNPNRYAKAYGTVVRKGAATPERPHRPSRLLYVPDGDPQPIPRAALEAIDAEFRASRVAIPVVERTARSESSSIARASAYSHALPPAIAGRRGHERALYAACKVGPGFDLSEEEAFQVLRADWNPRCIPPWSDVELRRKVAEAFRVEQRRGFLSTSRRSSQGEPDAEESLPGPAFPCAIPDFVWTDPDFSLGEMSEHTVRPRSGSSLDLRMPLRWLCFAESQRQRRMPIVVPDRLWAAVVWGAALPRDWRRKFERSYPSEWTVERKRRNHERLTRTLELLIDVQGDAADAQGHLPFIQEVERSTRTVESLSLWTEHTFDERCPLHATSLRHEHYLWRLQPSTLGRLAALWITGEDDTAHFDPDRQADDGQPLRKKYPGSLYAAYLPVQLFGRSPRIRMPARRIRLVQAIMRERTLRSPGRGGSTRDRVDYVRDALVYGSSGDARIVCPFLERDVRYVNFGGNLRQHRARGYLLLGETRKGWVRRAGYPVESADAEAAWAWVVLMLRDFEALSADFEFVVCGVNRHGAWKSLQELIELARRPRTRSRASTFRLRVFAPEDHLTRWRIWFARKLGFSYIAGGTWSLPRSTRPNLCLDSPEAVRAWLSTRGIAQKDLARELGRAPSLISGYLTRSRRWTTGFQALVEEFAARIESTPEEGAN